ncbi:hypothetical protein ACTXT7_012042 [Hymenolepis weldensis]
MPSSNPYDDLKFATLERIEGLKLEFSKWLGNELIYGGNERSQPQERDESEPDPPQTNSDDSSSTTITPKTESDTHHFHTYNREYSKVLLFIVGDSNSYPGEEK